MKKVIENFGEKFLKALSFALSFEKYGIPLELLIEYLEPFVESNDGMQMQEQITSSLKLMKNVCTCKIISGHLFVQWLDARIGDYADHSSDSANEDLIESLKKTSDKILLEKLDTDSLIEQYKADKINRSQPLFSYIQKVFFPFRPFI